MPAAALFGDEEEGLLLVELPPPDVVLVDEPTRADSLGSSLKLAVTEDEFVQDEGVLSLTPETKLRTAHYCLIVSLGLLEKKMRTTTQQ